MSLYRSLLAAAAAIAIASPVFADDAAVTSATDAAPTAATTTSTAEAAPVEAAKTIATAEQAAPAAEATINVNKATAKELLKVKGLNAAKARAIVAYRKKHGEFKSIDGVAKVKALSKLKADQLKAIEAQLSV